MDYIKETTEDLRHYGSRRRAVKSLREKILILQEDFARLKGRQTTSVPVQGGSSSMETSLINNIAERDRLKQQLRIVSLQINWLEKGLEALDSEERLVLEYFYIDRPPDHVGVLCEKLNTEKTMVYRKKDAALRKLAERLYGV